MYNFTESDDVKKKKQQADDADFDFSLDGILQAFSDDE